MKGILYYCLICLTGVSIIISQSSCEKKSESRIAMPQGLENVYIGMSFKEFKLARPKAEEFVLPPESTVPGFRDYEEKELTNDFFDKGPSYKFSDKLFQGEKLSMISLVGRVKGKEIRERIQGLVKGCIEKWGDTYKLLLLEGERKDGSTYRHPVFMWNMNNVEIHMTYKANILKHDEIIYKINIFNPSVSSTIYSFVQEEPAVLKRLEELYLLEDISNYNGPIFE